MNNCIKTYETVNYRNSALNDEYNELQKQKEEIRDKLSELHKRMSDIEKKETEINKEEVLNVINYVRDYVTAGMLDKHEIVSLLCHCQNKLNGNLDSTFLTFKNPEEKTNETKD